MVTLPAPTPVIVPATTVATEELLVVHVPPPVVSVSEVVAPVHTVELPVIVAGCVFTVTTRVAVQPAGNV